MDEVDCDGCLMVIKHEHCQYSGLENCPCSNCLVKAMCKVKCEELKVGLAEANIEGYFEDKGD